MQSVPLAVKPRSAIRRTALKAVRAENRIPAVIYGAVAEPQALSIDSRTFTDLLHHHASEHLLVKLTVEGDERSERMALLKDVQHNPLTRQVLHVDFHEIVENAPVTMSIPVASRGEAVGVKLGGGLLERVLQQVKVRGLVKDIPEVLVVDVTALDSGATMHIGELPPIPGVEFLGSPSNPVFTVSGKKARATAEGEGEAAAAAPAAKKKAAKK
ncbi:MAG: 50S ribosomal protein L25 [Verrucomicrobiae bacterium]|jgi:large subunit ribosomal protein L25|nr:50S ribosomal protein L25 [Verrucomicrobiae bacterium]